MIETRPRRSRPTICSSASPRELRTLVLVAGHPPRWPRFAERRCDSVKEINERANVGVDRAAVN
jgi:uridine phosphorylase